MIERYALPQMAKVWDEESKLSKMLKIEILTCEALAKIGRVPKAAAKRMKRKARFNLRRVEKIEEKTRHDVVAFVENVAQNLGRDAQYLHLGLTSSDLLDTAVALQMREAADILAKDLKRLLRVLARKAKTYKDTPCIGRTHGVHAEPTSFGLKLALMFDEMQRNLKRLLQAKEEICVGKISGAVGTYVHIEPDVEGYVCKRLGLKPAKISTQIISRDRHAQFLTTLALIGSSLERFAMEIRHLQKTEVLEAEEPFRKGQKGSSAMPHKRNPIICERICGLARILRANSLAAMENISLWHERDISHSSVERVILPDSTILLDYILNKFTQVIDGLLVYPENMLANLAKTKGLIFSQRVMLELMKKGLTRPKAYTIIQNCSMKIWKEQADFEGLLLKDKRVRRYLSAREIRDCFNIDYHLRFVNKIFKKVGLR